MLPKAPPHDRPGALHRRDGRGFVRGVFGHRVCEKYEYGARSVARNPQSQIRYRTVLRLVTTTCLRVTYRKRGKSVGRIDRTLDGMA